ncbi:MAG TPA: FAD-dependent monooxygenase [Polyangiaceae bacterium]|jgi:2-polyprenyl-6-methoxyphenol hydroxylase-like FAD-dependent oxidoreductase
MKSHETPVLIVGGSLVGLSAAMLLGVHGVRAVLVEPHLGSSPHPRAIGYTPRTMEVFAQAGIVSKIPRIPPGFRLIRQRVESLAGKWFESSSWTPAKPGRAEPEIEIEHSPYTGAAIAQDALEPILREHARELGADLRLGTSLVSFEQDGDGVTAHLRDRSGREHTLRAAYMIAADGNESGVREALGVRRKGPGHLITMRSVLFRAPLESYLERGVSQFDIEQPGLDAFLTTYGDGRWVLMFKDDVERDADTLRACITKAVGADVPIEIITTGRWELTALVADAFSAGRVFLAGDAAHTLPPTRGGYGANTGIHDVHNLAWKLARVLADKAPHALLDSYDTERRPIAWTRLEQTFARPDYAKHGRGFAADVEILDETAIELGQIARSSVILGSDTNVPVAARPDVWRGEPGTRAPHVRVGEGSALDAFGRAFVLVTGDAAWRVAAERVGLDVLDANDAVSDAFGIGAVGASLVRPDGVVAWRTTDAVDRDETLRDVMARVGA